MTASPRIYSSLEAFRHDFDIASSMSARPALADGAALLVLGGSRADRIGAAVAQITSLLEGGASAVVWADVDPAGWPFRPELPDSFPDSGPAIIWVHDLERAFPAEQIGGTRLVLTQSTYLLQRCFDRLAAGPPFLFLATADEAALRHGAAEAFSGRGPWARFDLVRLPSNGLNDEPPIVVAHAGHFSGRAHGNGVDDTEAMLREAFTGVSPAARLEACRLAVTRRPDWPVAWLALASAAMEQQQLDAAAEAIDRAVTLAPEWPAVHFERGKLWLRYDDMERASEAFARAGELMPTFSAAFSNLGATLGELDRPEAAVEAFRHALEHDPNSFTILNNIGVVCRELGRLDESERALRRVIELAPDFTFGHYNLGHTLFLQGRFEEARVAYEEGQRRDPERNPRQACRLALTHLAAGDPAAALRDLGACIAGQPPEVALDLLDHAREILDALVAQRPDLPGGAEMASLIRSAIERVQRR